VSKNKPARVDPDSASAQPVSVSVLTPPVLLQTYDDVEWERFVLEWVEGATPAYVHLDRIGGSGDKGRDIVAYTGAPNTLCDLDVFQCKHYAHPLMPSDIWRELGKLCVYTHRSDYRVPRHYRIVAPRGVGGSLGDLLTKPDQIRQGLIDNWDAKCRDHITGGKPISLEGPLLDYVRAFDFTILGHVPVNQLLEQHRRTRHWHTRFKRDYPARPAAGNPPEQVQTIELRYVRQLLDAYGQHTSTLIDDVAGLSVHPRLSEHFRGCRTDFFMADGLNRFYRDQFPEGAFEHVKDQVHQGVRNTVLATHANGYVRVCATLAQAAGLPLAQTEYVYCVQPGDKSGLCHHLANDDRVQWVQP